MEEREIRLRIVEALTHTDGSLARNHPEALIEQVDVLYNYVINGCQPKAKPPDPTPAKTEVAVTRRRRKSR